MGAREGRGSCLHQAGHLSRMQETELPLIQTASQVILGLGLHETFSNCEDVLSSPHFLLKEFSSSRLKTKIEKGALCAHSFIHSIHSFIHSLLSCIFNEHFHASPCARHQGYKGGERADPLPASLVKEAAINQVITQITVKPVCGQ